MDKKPEIILFLSEMPITNGVIQAQLLPIVFEASRQGYRVEILETIGRFDSQEKFRQETEEKLRKNKVLLRKMAIPQRTFLPSILYFTFNSLKVAREFFKNNTEARVLIYARNYKFCPVLLLAKFFWKIPYVYSPRAAYVAERKFYRKTKDVLFSFWIKFLEKRTIQKSQATVLETEEFQEHLEKLYDLKDSSNLKVIYNYFDASLLPCADWNREAMREKLGVSGKKVVVYAGTAEVWYEFEKMFDLVSCLKKRDSLIFFQLFLKQDNARQESKNLVQAIGKLADKYGFQEKKDYAISSYPPAERYYYLSACDAGICLAVHQEFKAIMLSLKIVDYVGSNLPVILNRDLSSARKIIDGSNAGVMVDYENWENSIASIDLEKLFQKKNPGENRMEQYSSLNVIPQYLKLFKDILERQKD